MNFRQLLADKSKDRRKYTPEQIRAVKTDLESGMSFGEVCRKHGMPRWIVRDVKDRRSWRGVETTEVEPREPDAALVRDRSLDHHGAVR